MAMFRPPNTSGIIGQIWKEVDGVNVREGLCVHNEQTWELGRDFGDEESQRNRSVFLPTGVTHLPSNMIPTATWTFSSLAHRSRHLGASPLPSNAAS